MSTASQGDLNQQALYGRHDRVADARADIETDHMRWRNRWAEKVAHRAVNQPMDGEQEEMHVDNSRKGMDWKDVSALGGLGIAVFMAVSYVAHPPAPAREPAPYNYVPPVHVPTEHVPTPHTPQPRTEPPPHQHTDRDTLMVPRLRFGPER